jgi:RimJ/RimL family protein N-acetyltransferase
VQQAELPLLVRLLSDPEVPGEFQWFGYRVGRVRAVERQWDQDGLLGDEVSFLTVDVDGTCAGWVTWRRFDTSSALDIGVALFPEHRGKGVGTDAHRQLVRYLFDTTPVHRLQAGTEMGNLAEQHALERAGFLREGVVRGLYFRAGQWRDSVLYGLTREDV